ncbi:hypothetical protein BDV38DRAFT_1633 [Aspergillus pseudotamarii]|uniref:Uncharacterized protein n=1 Tax=Aspergillus pseudotamarii TaxID=132259 RepID=A0A5N6TBM1_ASPPS|nr:uncharacterized protein BDV38DRAFT_1633 [Aspergillus pseudotamarii]KAE8143667.1 hypothetical protein BDV38DRAFT_1633 [Aspergillus pseudotamarii]
MEPPKNDLGQPGAKEGPVIDVIKAAVARFGISLNRAEYGPQPPTFPPLYTVIAEISADISEDVFKDGLQGAWFDPMVQSGAPLPQAEIDVQEYAA